MSLLLQKNNIFMKNYSKEDNVKLIKLVEEHECLWNSKHWEYFDKSSTANAWVDIAEKINDTPRKCKQRWRTIRNMFGKTTLPTFKNKPITYYLEPYLDFLRPFIRTCCRSKTCCQLAGRGKQTEADAQDESGTNKRVNLYEVVDLDTSSEDSTEFTDEPKDTRDDFSDNEVKKDESNAQDIQNQTTSRSNQLDSNLNMMFLESLLPFVDEMTSSQNRRFRLKVLTMVDDILD